MKSEFYVDGRKQPLIEIRERTLRNQEEYMRHTSDEEYRNMPVENITRRLKTLNEYDEEESVENMTARLQAVERTRHIKVWHDLSTIANHGHLVFMVSCLYDPAIYLTTDEYYHLSNTTVDIQSMVEKPEVYIVARSGSSDVEQLAYIDSRLECLEDMEVKLQTNSGHYITDVMRFFHGDSPARQFECGQQKGGNFYCSGCGANAKRAYELDYCLRCPHMSLSDRQQLMLHGSLGRKNSLLKAHKPLKDLNKEELIKELNCRSIFEGKTKKELEQLLAEEMHGVQRVPALLYSMPTNSLASINCEKYEMLPFEPLHDVGKHIENVITELPAHLPEEEANAMKELINVLMGAKETKRTFDYRCTSIILAKHSTQQSSKDVQQLLNSLVEIQKIAYSSDSDRTPKSVLRFHSMTWYHGILCREVFGFKLKEMTARKLYGNYFHDITSHAAMQHRLICGKSCNVEEQERVFNTITNITKTTSSNHPSHIIGNVFIRLQAEKQMDAFQSTSVAKQQSSVSKLASSLQPCGNTIIPHKLIQKHQRSWQAHLEKVSDYLLIGKGAWWIERENGDIEFQDGEQCPDFHPEGPSLHHYRSSNLKDEEKYLQECWKKCLHLQVSIPARVLHIEDEEGNMKIIRMPTYDTGSVAIVEVQAENESGVDCNFTNEEEVAPAEENIVSFQLAPDSMANLPLDEVDDHMQVVEAAECSSDAHFNLACTTVQHNDSSVKGTQFSYIYIYIYTCIMYY